MGLLQTIRDALALPSLAAHVDALPFESPWASPNHLLPVTVPDVRPVAVGRVAALRVPAVKRARDLLAANIARCPMFAYTGDTVAADQPRFLTRTDGPISPYHRMLWTVDDLLFYGWSCWAIQRDADRRMIAGDRVPFEMWEIGPDGRTVLYDGKPVDADSVVVIPGINAGLLAESSPTISDALELNSSAASAARTPAPQVILKQIDGPPMDDADIEKLKAGYLAARRSPDGGVAYANRNIDVIEKGKRDPSLLLDGRNMAAVEVARITGVPASMLDAGLAGSGSITYANADARMNELIDFGLAPYMAAIAGRLGLDDVVPRGTRIEFDTSGLTGVAGGVDVPDDRDTPPTPPPAVPTPAAGGGPTRQETRP